MVAISNPDPIDVHVGARIRLRRKQIGISQAQLGEALGLTFQQIQKYEKGQNRISASMMVRAAQKLDVAVGYFVEGLEGLPEGSGDAEQDIQALKAADAVPQVRSIPGMARETKLALGVLLEGLAKGRGD